MPRFTAITGLILLGLGTWFSAAQTVQQDRTRLSASGGHPVNQNRQTTFGQAGIEPQSGPPARSSLPTIAGDNLRVRVAELNSGSHTLKLPAGQDFFLLVSSIDVSHQTTPLTISRVSPHLSTGRDANRHWDEIGIRTSNAIRTSSNANAAELNPVSAFATRATGANRNRPPESVSTSSNRFFIHVTEGPLDDPKNYATIHTQPIEESSRLRILLDTQLPKTDRLIELARRIREQFETRIFPVCHREFGRWKDVDRDGKLTVLLSPWLDRLQGGKTSLKGFVKGTDFDNRIPEPLGNRCDMMYLNPTISATDDLTSLLAHEYFHVLQFSYRGASSTELPIEEDWLSEAQAHLAELSLHGDDSNLKHRIESFLAAPGSAPLVVEDYWRAGLWRDDSCRGATFLFLQWCASRSEPGFLNRLLHSSHTGVRNIEWAMGRPFRDLHRNWTLDLLANALPRSSAFSPAGSGSSDPFASASHPIPTRGNSLRKKQNVAEAMSVSFVRQPDKRQQYRREFSQGEPGTGRSGKIKLCGELNLIPLPVAGGPLEQTLAPSSVLFFQIPASQETTQLKIGVKSQATLDLSLIGANELSRWPTR